MKTRICIGLCLFSFLIFTFTFIRNHHHVTIPVESNNTEIQAKIENLEIPFVENQGQFDETARFCARTFSGTVFVTRKGAIVYDLYNPRELNDQKRLALTEELVDGQVNLISGEKKSGTTVSYFRGNDRSKWQNGQPTFEYIDFGQVYEKIELKLRAKGNNVEKIFYVKPGGRPNDIRIKLSGADGMTINEAGELELATELDAIAFTRPMAYQEIHGERHFVDAGYNVSNCEYGFVLGEYDPGQTLVIDPLLASTYLGGSGLDKCYNISVAAGGIVYVTGQTQSANFPTVTGAYDASYNGGDDIFIAKLDRNLQTLFAITFIGGGSNDTAGWFLPVVMDGNGTIYIAGNSASTNFPTTLTAYNHVNSGGNDAFIARFNPDLTTLQAATLIGGSGNEWASSLKLAKNGDVFLAGYTRSTNFPTTSNAFDRSYNGTGAQVWGGDIFISKFNNDLSVLQASTFLGGNNVDEGGFIALDENDNVYVTGTTGSNNFPVMVGAFDRSYNGGSYIGDIFISKLSKDLSKLMASTLLGGNQNDWAYCLALDHSGNVYVTGHIASANFPTTAGAFKRNYTGVGGADVGDDSFVAKLDSGLSTLLASTYLGGSGHENGFALAFDDSGNVYVGGTTGSTDFPMTDLAFSKFHNGGRFQYGGDAFISKLDRDLSTLKASSYIGGTGKEGIMAIVPDDSGNVYLAGFTNSANFPACPGAYDDSFNGGRSDNFSGDGFVLKLDGNLSRAPILLDFHADPPTGHAPVTVQFTDATDAIRPLTSWAWDFDNDGTFDSDEQNPTWTYERSGNYTVRLQVSDGIETETLIREEFIQVFAGESALFFRNKNSYATCPATPSLNLTESLTIEAWVNPSGWGTMPNAGFGRVVDKLYFSLFLVGSNLNFNNHSLTLQLYHANGTNTISTTPANSIVLDTWQHLAVTYDGTTNQVRMYINGVDQPLTQTKPPSGNLTDNSNCDLIIGDTQNQAFTFDGSIDEVRLWHVALDGTDINAHMNNYLSGTEPDLVGYWQMNEGNGDTLKDNSGYGNHAIITNSNWTWGHALNPTPVIATSTDNAPKRYILYNNYPNPFNARTTIRFDLPVSSPVQLAIYNVTGELVKRLVQGKRAAGTHIVHWNGSDEDGRVVSSGFYLCKMQGGEFSETKKMLLLK